MPGRHPAGLLRVELDAISAVRAAFEEALTELRPQLLLLQDEAMIPEPWLGDATSAEVASHYQQRVIEAAEGPLAAMRAYELELIRILDSLKAIEDGYLRSDTENAGGLRPV
jgi:hypothetical protein